MSDLTVYLGYFLHETFGATSTKHIFLRQHSPDEFILQEKLQEFSTGGLGSVLSVLEDILTFTSATELASFCASYSLDPEDIIQPIHSIAPNLAKELATLRQDTTLFPKDFKAEHTPLSPDKELFDHILDTSVIKDLIIDKEAIKPKNKQQGKVLQLHISKKGTR